ncbi:MAG: rubrerythrin family protein [Anaerolineae bacterium]
MTTMDDLKAAFAGESQANRRYLAFAEKAEEEGLPNIARLFRAVAAAETVHAHSHFRTMGGVKSTAENLKTAIAGENYEVKTMYPEFMENAKEAGERRAEITFKHAWEVEKIHEQLYRAALEQVERGDIEAAEYYVCSVCGHTHVGAEPPERCPICGAKRERYMKIE